MDLDKLDDTEWDIVISGTGLPQSLFALALSRSGKRILHLDRNYYYGGNETALCLSEAEAWAERHALQEEAAAFSHASISKPTNDEDVGTSTLGRDRAYSLALAPQLMYTRSNLIPALVSSRTQSQIEFLAMGSWFVASAASTLARLDRVPSSREDIFQDQTLNVKAKRSLVKFIRFVAQYEEQAEIWEEATSMSFPAFLEQKFSLPEASHAPLLALTLTGGSLDHTTVEVALPRIARHLRSIGLFGPGFGAVYPQFGGLSEVAQVACRACAVGGGVYVLGKGVKTATQDHDTDEVHLELSDGEKILTNYLVGCADDLPPSQASIAKPTGSARPPTSRSISIVSSPLSSLFPLTAEGGVMPAGAVIVVPAAHSSELPVHVVAHSAASGECPSGQCVLYASVALPHDSGFQRLQQAVDTVMNCVGERPAPSVLWRMQYQQNSSTRQAFNDNVGSTFTLPDLGSDLALEDNVLDGVKTVWQKITGEDEEVLMKFDAREGADEEG